jgi:hypothetical protein
MLLLQFNWIRIFEADAAVRLDPRLIAETWLVVRDIRRLRCEVTIDPKNNEWCNASRQQYRSFSEL